MKWNKRNHSDFVCLFEIFIFYNRLCFNNLFYIIVDEQAWLYGIWASKENTEMKGNM